MSQKKPRIATVGYLMNDWLLGLEHFPVAPGDHQTLRHLEIEPGGMSNFLIAGQRFGAQMVALDAIGADRYGLMLLDNLRAEGVDVSQVVKVRGARSRAVTVVSTADDRHAFMSYPGDDLPVQLLYMRWRRTLASVDALYVDGFSMLQEHIMGAVFQASEKVHGRGGKTFFDPGPSLVGISRNLLCDYSGVFLTEDELRKWLGSADTEAARSLIAQGPELVVIKQGAKGCLVVTADETYPCPGISVPVRDTMGAGDVFNAAFMVAMLTGHSLPECGTIANAAGAAAVQKFGAGRNVPTLAEVKTLQIGQ